MICFISLPLWAVFVALARGDLIIISPMGQVVNIIFQVFWFFLKVFAFPPRIPVFMRVCGIFTFLKRMCKAHSLARRVHLRQTTASRECASPAHNSFYVFYVIGNSIGISYYIKKQTTTGNYPGSCLPNHFILGVSSIYYCASAAYTFSFSASFSR